MVLRDGLARALLLLALAIAAAEVASAVGMPLAWMIGPMLVATALSVSGYRVPMPRQMRMVGQNIVATAVGLQLTTAGVLEVAGLLPEMLTIAIGSAGLAIGLAPILFHLTDSDKATSFFACVPCGPAEMAQLAELGGGNGPLVGLVQGLRIALVVLVVPASLQFAGVPISDLLTQRHDLLAIGWMTPVAIVLAAAAGVLAQRVGMVSPFFLGPLTATSILALTVDVQIDYPRALIFAGQLMVGLSLGLSFSRDLLRGAPRFVLVSAMVTLLSIAGCAALAWAISAVDGLPLATLVLAAAPGSITEMSLTAQAMGLGVALVTTFHIVRLFIIMPLSPLALRFVRAPKA